MAFSWSRPTPLEVTRRLDPDRRIYIISDLHLGDGTRSDAFLGKDRDLIRFLDRVRDEGAHLVIAGDAIDFQQAWTLNRVLKAHPRLIGELSRLADKNGVTYIWGNHDSDIASFRDVLRFDVCSRLEIGDQVLVQHGYEYDPHIGPNLEHSHVASLVHHGIERVLDAWIRLPLENYYTLPNRLAFWVVYHWCALAEVVDKGLTAMGVRRPPTRGTLEGIHYWIQNQLGDPGMLLRGARRVLEEGEFRYLVCGHSHLPGKVEVAPDRTYINTGSWTFNSSQYALWDGEDLVVRDWIRGREYSDDAYRPILSGRFAHMSFREWWRENYLGWLRYRVGEEGRLPHLQPIGTAEHLPGA